MNLLRKKIRGIRRRLIDAYWERRFQVETYSLERQVHKDGHWYVTVPYEAIFEQLRAVKLGAGDTLVDIGCGKGRVMLAATRFGVERIIGVELNGKLCEVARENVGRLKRSRVPIEILHMSATDFDTTVGTVFYLFNPFGEETMRAFLARVKEGVEKNRRRIRILYSMPWVETVFAEQGWLRKTGEFEVLQFGGSTMVVTVWENVI